MSHFRRIVAVANGCPGPTQRTQGHVLQEANLGSGAHKIKAAGGAQTHTGAYDNNAWN